MVRTVHTTGINWESIGVISASVATIVTAFWAALRRSISGAINNLSAVLLVKLETKENVADLRKDVAVQGEQIHQIQEQLTVKRR